MELTMKLEHKEKFDRIKKSIEADVIGLSDEEIDRLNEELDLVNELADSKDPEVLPALFDLLIEEEKDENTCLEGFSEPLAESIARNYALEQVLEVFFEKFDSMFSQRFPSEYVGIATWFFEHAVRAKRFFEEPMSKKFREKFNALRSKYSETFLLEMVNSSRPELNKIIETLYQDMKGWPYEQVYAQRLQIYAQRSLEAKQLLAEDAKRLQAK
jgi:hypothetical protein